MQNGKSVKWKNKKNKKDLKPKVFFNFLCYIDISGNIFCWVEKKIEEYFGGRTGKTEPQV